MIARSTVTNLTLEDTDNPAVKAEMIELDESIRNKIGDKKLDQDVRTELGDAFPTVPQDVFELPPDEDEVMAEPNLVPEADDYTADSYSNYLSADLLLPVQDEILRGKVIKRKLGEDGNPIGQYNTNPILDTTQWEVEFSDGSEGTYSANVIAENMYAQVDDEGHEMMLLSEITEHKSDGSAVSKDDGYTVGRHGRRSPRMTTKGWKLLCEWKDGSSSWVPLKDLKESNRIEVAEYAIANKIAEEPAFIRWVRLVLRTQDRMSK